MSIDIWNARELPFGPLSNNAIFLMDIDGETYNTVTNYIYSNLINSKEYFNLLKNINTHDIYDYFTKYEKETVNKIVKSSLMDALDSRFKDKRFEDLLLSTETYPIVYASNDSLVGSGPSGNGYNLYGKLLTELRSKLNLKYDKKESGLYNAYIALDILERSIREEGNDLTEFAGLNHQDIINKYIYNKALKQWEIQRKQFLNRSTEDVTKLGLMEPVDIRTLKYEDVIEKFKNVVNYPSKDIIKFLSVGENREGEEDGDNIKILKLLQASLTKPYLLLVYVKKKYYNDLRISQTGKIKTHIFNIYINNILKSKYPDLPESKYEDAKSIEFNINANELEIIKDEIYNFYKEKLLPETVLQTIDNTVNFEVLSEQRVKSIEGFDVEYMYKSENKQNEPGNYSIIIEENPRLTENPYSALSPIAFVSMINIKGKNYPSIMHYVVTNLFSLLPEVKTINNAHKYLLVDKNGDVNDFLNYESYNTLFYEYEQEKFNQSIKQRRTLAIKALNKKFEDTGIQELLIATGANELVWKDPYDDILGVGFSGGGENFVGKYLQDLRYKFEQNEDIVENVNNNDIAKIIKNDIFMRSWLEMRLNDICNVVTQVKKYISQKYNKEVETNIDFIINVINKIYQPCMTGLKLPDFVESDPPSYFIKLAKKCFKLKTTDPLVFKQLWNKIIVLVHFVLKFVPKLKNMKAVLAKIELLVSENKECVEIIDNNFDNCIISAIINIIIKLKTFNKYFKKALTDDDKVDVTLVTKHDIETAINIILNKSDSKLDNTIPDFSTFIPNNTVGNFAPDEEQSKEDKFVDDMEEFLDKSDIDEDHEDQTDFCKNLIKTGDLDSFDMNECDIQDDDLRKLAKEEQDDVEMGEEYMRDYNYETEGEEDGANYKKAFNTPFLRKRNEMIMKSYEEKDRERFNKYKNVNKITLFLDKNGIRSVNNSIIADNIIDAVNVIKKHEMSKKVKINRINFFASDL